MKTCRKGGKGEWEKGSRAFAEAEGFPSVRRLRRWRIEHRGSKKIKPRYSPSPLFYPPLFSSPFPPFSLAPFPVLLLILFLLPACGYYSFTGATIPSNLATIAIPLVQDNSLSPLTALDEEMTRRLIDRFVQQTRLSLETSEEEADAVLTATLDRYTNAPTSVTGEERAQRNRVTISVSVRYYDQVEDEELIQRTFSSFEDYDPVVDGLDGERVAALAALENIADDIFTAATSNW